MPKEILCPILTAATIVPAAKSAITQPNQSPPQPQFTRMLCAQDSCAFWNPTSPTSGACAIALIPSALLHLASLAQQEKTEDVEPTE